MATATRTIGPLHFEDLEPKRFEDLARQLVYDFKPWRRLEATGRAGSDDGFDARGYEIVDVGRTVESADESDDADLGGTDDRLWLVQCKRERVIGPTKLLKYLDEIKLDESEKLHGIVFIAACDFSKSARDKFKARCEALGVLEWHLWGKAELEDKLMRPDNDGLLFAYFGISLTIRRRSQRADLRARLVMKRKVNRVLEPKSHSHALLRSPDAATYPYLESAPDFEKRPPWVVRAYRGIGHDGAKFCVHRHFAYLSDDGESWDAAFCADDAFAHRHEDPWGKRERNDELRAAAHIAWDEFPPQNKAWLEVIGVIPFESILDIDELGDEYVDAPHVYVPFVGENGPFTRYIAAVTTIGRFDQRELNISNPRDGRIAVFAPELRDMPKDYSTSPGPAKQEDTNSA